MTPLNRFVPEYHPIITTYITEICRVRTETTPATNLPQDLVSRSLFSVKIKQTFFEKYFLCCFRPLQEEQSDSMDMFRQPSTFDIDADFSKDMDSPADELSLAVIDTELHLSALIRHINICKERMMLVVDPKNAHLVYPYLVKLVALDNKHNSNEEQRYKNIRKRLLQNGIPSDSTLLQSVSPVGIEIPVASPTAQLTKSKDQNGALMSGSPLSAFLPKIAKSNNYLAPDSYFETIMESGLSGSYDGGLAVSIKDTEAFPERERSPVINARLEYSDIGTAADARTATLFAENTENVDCQLKLPGISISEHGEPELDAEESYLKSFNSSSHTENFPSIQGSSELVEDVPMIPDSILVDGEPAAIPDDEDSTSYENPSITAIKGIQEETSVALSDEPDFPISQSGSVVDEDEADAYVIQKRPSVASSSKPHSRTSSGSAGDDKRGSMKHRRSITSIKDPARRRSSAFAFKGGLASAMYQRESIIAGSAAGSAESLKEDPIFDFLHTVGKKGKEKASTAVPGPSGNRRKSSHQLSESGSFIVRKNH